MLDVQALIAQKKARQAAAASTPIQLDAKPAEVHAEQLASAAAPADVAYNEAMASARARKQQQLDLVARNSTPPEQLVLSPAHTVFVTTSRGLTFVTRGGKRLTFTQQLGALWAYKTANTTEIAELRTARYIWEWDTVNQQIMVK